MRRFEFSDDKSNKFWEVEQDGSSLNIRWGKIGTTGQSQTKGFDTEAKAGVAMTKLINEKTGKGYAETTVSADASIGAAPEKVVTEKPAKSAAKSEKTAEPAPAAELVNTTPAESLDSQADRAFQAIVTLIASNDDAYKDTLTVNRLKRDYQISEPAALQTLQRLAASNLAWGYSGSYRINQNNQAIAARLAGIGSSMGQVAELEQIKDGSVPPWLANGAPLRLLPELICHAAPTRRFPQQAKVPEISKIWYKLRNYLNSNIEFNVQDSTPELQQGIEELIERIKSPKHEGSSLSDTLLLACALAEGCYDSESGTIDFIFAKGGMIYLMESFLAAQSLTVSSDYKSTGKNGYVYVKTFLTEVQSSLTNQYYPPLGCSCRDIMTYLSSAPEDVYRQCLQMAEMALPGLHPSRQPAVALLFPDQSSLSDQVALEHGGIASAPPAIHWLQLTASAPEAIAAARKVRSEANFWDHNETIATLLQERGIDALEILLPGAACDAAGQALGCIGLPEAVEALARVASSSKVALSRFSQAVERWPHAAVAAMARVIAGGGKDASLITPNMLQLICTRPELVQELTPWLDKASLNAVMKLKEQIDGPRDVAGDNELPELLVSPPWLKGRKAAVKPISIEPLPLVPVEFWEEGEREEHVNIDNKWTRERVDKCRGSVDKILKEIGFDSGSSTARLQKLVKDGDGQGLAEAWVSNFKEQKAKQRYYYSNLSGIYVTLLPREAAISFWNCIVPEILKNGSYIYSNDNVIAAYGLEVLPAMRTLATSRPTEYLAEALHFGDVSLAPIAARAFVKLKSLRQVGRAWLLRFPEHAVCGLLAPAMGKLCEARDCAATALRFLVANGHETMIMEKAALYGQPDVVKAVSVMLDEDPLDRFPSKVAPLPQFWLAKSWSRPRLKSGKALPEGALQHLGTMLSFPTTEELYPGISTIKEICEPQSLADFMWDAFSAWLNAGAPSKEGWALTMLGQLGNDETARKLTPYIRSWPGEAAHARAVTGLDVLAAIGSDVALMLLNGIAQKIKFKGLQDKAREKIDAIAEARGFSTEELEDRLAPDLGLDESGSLVLDFGPRQFKVGFDEALRPYVREFMDGRDGGRLSDLPKPKKSDDAELAKEAVDRFKLLKKDARTIAGQQVVRLETAMCSRRRWSEAVFRQFLAGHPLVRYLVQRLIWGVYQCEPESSNGGKLLTCFRVSEDGSYTNAEDDAITLTEGDNLLIGLPHALELPQEDAAAFGQLCADYELLQPFAQIGRDTYTISDAELSGEKLERWKGTVVPTGRVLGLVNKGWRRGQAQDGGSIWYFNKPLAGDKVIELLLDPGIIVGMVDEYPEQTLQEIQIGIPSSWGELQKPERLHLLDPISASELIRDMEALRG